MKNYVYVPGLSETVEQELKKEELAAKCEKSKKVSSTGAKKKYIQKEESGKMRNHLVDDRNIQIPLWEKYALTLKEAAQYYNIPETRLKSYMLENPTESFVLRAGVKLLVKRKMFDAFLDQNGKI